MNYQKRNERSLGKIVSLASIRRRFAAFLIDWVFIIILYFSILLIFSFLNINDWKINVVSVFEVDIETTIHSSFFIIFLKIFFGLLPVLYFTFFLYLTKGRTSGKYFLRLRVVSLFHEHLGLWHCFERSLGYFTSTLESGFGFFQAIWNPNRMALHDKIGETIVISIPQKKSEGSRLIKKNRPARIKIS